VITHLNVRRRDRLGGIIHEYETCRLTCADEVLGTRRITEHERGRIIALARSTPPGRPARTAGGQLRAADEKAPAQ
jgi:hypothetical protein